MSSLAPTLPLVTIQGGAKAGASLHAGDNSWPWERPGDRRKVGWGSWDGGPRLILERQERGPCHRGRHIWQRCPQAWGAPGRGRQSAERSDTLQITSPAGKTTSPGHWHTTSPQQPRGCHQSPELESPHPRCPVPVPCWQPWPPLEGFGAAGLGSLRCRLQFQLQTARPWSSKPQFPHQYHGDKQEPDPRGRWVGASVGCHFPILQFPQLRPAVQT